MFRFSEIKHRVERGQPGIYEIHTTSGLKLKVGVSGDLHRRLCQHRASRQSGLHLPPGGDWSNPNDVRSKQSIMTKHLYYDGAIAPDYDLKSEAGRCEFLEDRCVVTIEPTASRADAVILERQQEATGEYRYVGEVIVRRMEAQAVVQD